MFTPPYLFIVLYGITLLNVLNYLYFNSQNVIIVIVREEIMKKKIILAVLIATLLTGCGKTIPTLSDGKEAVVTFEDGSMISIDELYDEVKKSATTTLISMIDKKILEEDYSDKLDEAKEYAANAKEAIKKYFVDDKGNYDEASLYNYLNSYYGMSSLDQYEEETRIGYLKKQAIEDYVKENLKDKEIEKYYKDEIVGDREVYHIQITPETKTTMTETEKKEAEQKSEEEAKAIIARLKKGEKFEDLAKEASDDESTKENGGNLGFINKEKYGSEEFDKEVYKLKVGEYSNVPVKTTTGYEIVFVNAEKEKESLEDIKEDIVETLVQEKLSDDATLQVTAIKEIRKKHGVDIIDSEIEKNYNTYMNRLMEQMRQQNATSSDN